MEERLTLPLQESLLSILCFDSDHCRVVRNLVASDLFEGHYSNIASRVYEFIDEYNSAPGDDLATLFDDILDSDSEDRDEYIDIFENLSETQEGVKAAYIISRLQNFVTGQNLKNGIMEAAELIQGNTQNALDDARNVLIESTKVTTDLFNPGIRFSDIKASLNFLNHEENTSFMTGIEELDRRGLGPNRKELHVFMALAKKGKSWWLINLAKRALMQRLKVAHVTLEMSEDRVCQRYYQSFFAVPKTSESFLQTIFIKDALNSKLEDYDRINIKPKLSLDDVEIIKKLEKKNKNFRKMLDNLMVKEFPTGQLTINGLRGYLDNLEAVYNFVPDLLIVDYADLMSTNVDNYRLSLGKVYQDLRGLAIERNMAVSTATQSNREGGKVKNMGELQLSEDFSKAMITDCLISYNQTDAEKELDLARLFVALSRNDADKFNILLTQQYSTGQFALDSVFMRKEYDNIFED